MTNPNEQDRPADHSPPPINTRTLTDEQLVHAMLDRDRAAAAEWVMRRESAIRQRAEHALKGAGSAMADADDVVTMVAERMDRLVTIAEVKGVGPGGFEAVLGAMVGVSIREVRRQCARAGRQDDVARRRKPRAEPAPADAIADAESHKRLSDAIVAVRDDHDVDIALMRLRGLSHSVIAQQIGISIGAVRRRWSRIQTYLKDFPFRLATVLSRIRTDPRPPIPMS